MEFGRAIAEDLPQLKAVFRAIVDDMHRRRINIWNDFYPTAFFEDDIGQKRLYVLKEEDIIVSAFVLCESNEGEAAVRWSCAARRPLYLDRFGVHVGYAGKGIGSFMLKKAAETAKNMGADHLRLFVVDVNRPAIGLYEKNGFLKAAGVYDEWINDVLVLHEYGYEKKI